jgi:hypothetical protein
MSRFSVGAPWSALDHIWLAHQYWSSEACSIRGQGLGGSPLRLFLARLGASSPPQNVQLGPAAARWGVALIFFCGRTDVSVERKPWRRATVGMIGRNEWSNRIAQPLTHLEPTHRNRLLI